MQLEPFVEICPPPTLRGAVDTSLDIELDPIFQFVNPDTFGMVSPIGITSEVKMVTGSSLS